MLGGNSVMDHRLNKPMGRINEHGEYSFKRYCRFG